MERLKDQRAVPTQFIRSQLKLYVYCLKQNEILVENTVKINVIEKGKVTLPFGWFKNELCQFDRSFLD